MTVSYLTKTQRQVLTLPINATRVKRDPKGNSYVESWDIRSNLNKIFGIARWSEELLSEELVLEEAEQKENRSGKPYTAYTVAYRTAIQLTVCAVDGTPMASYFGSAVGASQNQPNRVDAHDHALKSSASGALKRAAVNLGDRFGLSLYNDGSFEPVVGRTAMDAHMDELEDQNQARPSE